MTELAQWPCDMVLNGVVGSLGLAPTLARCKAGRNSRTGQQGVGCGRWAPVTAAPMRPGQIVPVDCEHSALAQCLRGGSVAECGGWC